MSDSINYMQALPGGHCFICHKDYEETHDEHPCFKDKTLTPTPCPEACKQSKYLTAYADSHKWLEIK